MCKLLYSTKQLDFLKYADSAYNICHGSVRSGKTWITCVKFLMDLLRGPEGNSAIIGKTETTIFRNIIQTLEDILPDETIRASKNQIFLGGKKIFLVGANDVSAVSKIKGMTLARLLADEITEWPESVFDMALTRLSVPGAKLFGTTNPDSPQHWFYKRFSKIINGGEDPDTKLFHFVLDDNLTLSKQYKQRLKRQFSGVFFQRYIEGLWVVADGLVIGEFSPEKHRIEADEAFINIYNNTYKHYIAGVDWGIANPMAGYVLGVTRENKFDVLFEFYEKGKLTKHLIDWLKSVETSLGRQISYVFCDSAEPDRLIELQDYGLRAFNAKKSIMHGINTLKTQFFNENLRLHADCKNLENELLTCRYPQESESGFGSESEFVGDDHAIDALRYAVHSYKKMVGF